MALYCPLEGASAILSGRAVIGVTGPEKRFPQAWWATRLAIHLCGGLAVYLTPGRGDYHQLLNGVIIGGGDDIDPQLYGSHDNGLATIDRDRDAFEVDMIEHALETSLPIFGICRGMQLLNVVLGGSLYGDIRGMRHLTSNRRTPLPSKRVRLDKESRFNDIVDSSGFRINSLHHQAIDRLGKEMCPVAWDEDDFIQAIESTNEHFMMGVQWHPEYLPYLPSQLRIFKRIVQEAGAHHRERLM